MTQPAAAIATHDDTGKPVRVYRIPDPETGDVVDLPNISSVLDVLQTWGLSDWRLRMAAAGLVSSVDLAARVAAALPMPAGPERNRHILDACSDAIDLGQRLDPDRGHLANDFGSAIHLLTEHIDAGLVDDVLSLPASVAEHAARYVDLMAAHGVEVVHSEFTVWSRHGYAGTGDRIVCLNGDHAYGKGSFVLDLKTGKVKPSAAMQLAALVNADGIYNADTDQHEPLPDDLRCDVGFLLHLTAEGAALIPVDLTDAWPAFQGALAVKRFQESKPLAPALRAAVSTPAPDAAPSLADQLAASLDAVKVRENAEAEALLEGCAEPTHISEPLKAVIAAIPDDPEAGTLDHDGHHRLDRQAKTAWLVGRLKALLDLHPDIVVAWPEGVPTFREHREAGELHTADELLSIERAISDAERSVKAPFPPEDPSSTGDAKVAPGDPRVIEVGKRLAALPAEDRDALGVRAHDELDGRRFSIGTATADDLVWWERNLTAAEADVDARRQTFDVLVELLGFGVDQVVAYVGPYSDLPNVWQVNRLDELADCVSGGWLVIEDGAATITDDGRDHLVKEFGGRRGLLNAAKGAADFLGVERPSKADDVFANPLLAAHLALTESEPEQISPPPAA